MAAKELGIKARIRYINAETQFDSVVAVLNPYGEVYPEVDVKENISIQKIFSYVKNGGLFINVADVPLYYAYNSMLRRFVDTTEPVVTSAQEQHGAFEVGFTRFFQLNIIARELRLSLVGFSSGLQCNINHVIGSTGMVGLHKGQITSRRSVIIESNIETCVEPLPVTYQGQKKMTPILRKIRRWRFFALTCLAR